MVPYLAFDSRSTRAILDTSKEKVFGSQFPVFYKNEDGKSAIDVALANN